MPIFGEFSYLSLLAFAIGLFIIWIIVSIPVYLAAKVVMPDASFRDTMVATIFGPIVYVVTLFAANYFLSTLIGSQGYIWALILAFIAWVFVFKGSFRTGWLKSLVIALLTILVFAFVSYLFGVFLGVMVQTPFFPQF